MIYQGSVTHIHTVGRSSTAFNLKINGKLKILATVMPLYLFDAYSQIGQGQAKFQQ